MNSTENNSITALENASLMVISIGLAAKTTAFSRCAELFWLENAHSHAANGQSG
jgi:hypothetical protein